MCDHRGLATTERKINMEKKKSWILRPVAWASTVLMMLATQYIVDLMRKLLLLIYSWLNELPVVAIVIIVISLGGVVGSILWCAALGIPTLIVQLSDKIYPSHHAFRYYFVGVYEIVGCAFLLFAAVMGAVKGGSMFMFCAQYIYLIIISVVMMLTGRSEANDRNT